MTETEMTLSVRPIESQRIRRLPGLGIAVRRGPAEQQPVACAQRRATQSGLARHDAVVEFERGLEAHGFLDKGIDQPRFRAQSVLQTRRTQHQAHRATEQARG